MSLNVNTVICTYKNQPLTAANLLSIRVRHLLTDALQALDQPSFERYKEIRGSTATATLASRRTALAFALGRVGEIIIEHYARVE